MGWSAALTRPATGLEEVDGGGTPWHLFADNGSHRTPADGTLSVTTSTDVALRGERARDRKDTHVNSTLAVD
jgi:hypothetical protein